LIYRIKYINAYKHQLMLRASLPAGSMMTSHVWTDAANHQITFLTIIQPPLGNLSNCSEISKSGDIRHLWRFCPDERSDEMARQDWRWEIAEWW
jgi:hypothetical protein